MTSPGGYTAILMRKKMYLMYVLQKITASTEKTASHPCLHVFISTFVLNWRCGSVIIALWTHREFQEAEQHPLVCSSVHVPFPSGLGEAR